MPIIRYQANAFEEGEEYRRILNDEADRNLKIFFALMSSYWGATIDGPNYARELKSMSLALARIRLSLDQVRTDAYFKSTRPEFLYQTLTSILFPQTNGAPDPQLADLDFRDFLLNVLSIYFAGSVPASMQAAVKLFVDDATVVVKENFIEARNPGSGFDISDEFGYTVDIFLQTPSSINVILADKNIKILFDIIRPSHTLYRIKYILQDKYTGQQSDTQTNKVIDSSSYTLSDYKYEDFRKFVEGIDQVDLLGFKKPIHVTGEDHTADFP